MADPEYITD